MNRKIKFRLWSFDVKKYFHKEEVSILLDGRFLSETGIDTNQYDLQQFSGLINEFKEEVYEGDIVYVLGKKWEVKFENCAFIINAIDGSEKLPHYLGGYADCKVVGNIYEGIKMVPEVGEDENNYKL